MESSSPGLISGRGLLQYAGHGQLALEVFEAFGVGGDLSGNILVPGAFVDSYRELTTEMVGDPKGAAAHQEREDDSDPRADDEFPAC